MTISPPLSFNPQASVFSRFTDWFKSVIDAKNSGMITVALSGGNTPKALFDFWTMHHRDDIAWENIKFFWGDERCVAPTDSESNYKMTSEHLLDHLPIPSQNIFRIKGENDPNTEAKRYGHLLTAELNAVDGKPSFDIIILGMGDDGHTASIFPNQIELWNSPDVCVAATHPESGQRRVSLSGTTINAAQHVAFLVTGSAKAEKVRRIVEHRAEYENIYPAAKVNPTSGNLLWFADDAAAELLGK